MNVKKYKLYQFIIYISVILMIGYSRMLPFDIGSYNIGMFVIVLNLLLFGLTMTGKARHQCNRFVKRYLIGYLVIIVIEVINTRITLEYNYYELLKSFIPYMYIFISSILIYIFEKDGIKTTLNTISKIVTGILMIKALSWIAYNLFHVELFPELLFQYRGWVRDGYQRIDAGCLFFVAVVWNSYKAFKLKESKAWINLAFYVFFAVFITRYRILICVVCITVFTVFYYSQNRELTRLSIKIGIAAALLLIFLLGIYSQFVDLFSVNGAYGTSTVNRMNTLYHYTDILMQKKAWIGLGMLESTIQGSREYMLRATGSNGTSYYYWIDDIGLIGGVVRFGVFFMYIYIPLFWKAIKVFLNSKKTRSDKLPIIAGICVYMILSCVIFNIFDSQRAFDTPFYLALIGYSGWDCKTRGRIDHVINLQNTAKKYELKNKVS